MSILTYISNNVVTEDYFHDSLHELVTRSLLEYNKKTGRYHYHKLIKEYFLLHSTQSEVRRFNLAFQLYFSETLHRLTKKFFENNSPKISLSTLDVERHNFQYYIRTIQNPVNQIITSAISCFATAMYFNYLQCQFSLQELIKPVRSAVRTLRAELKLFRANRNFSMRNHLTHFFNVYDGFVHMTILLAKLTETLNGREQAVQVFLKGIQLVEEFGNLITMTDKDYIKFYSHLLSLESELSNSSMRLYHERVLKKQRELDCNADRCNYYDIDL